MKGLLLKDIYLSLRYFKAIFLAMGVFLILSFLETENSFFLFDGNSIAEKRAPVCCCCNIWDKKRTA